MTLLIKVTTKSKINFHWGLAAALLQMNNDHVIIKGADGIKIRVEELDCAIFIKGGVDSKPCKSIWFFRHGQRTELTIARGASAPWTEYQSGGEQK